MSELHVDDLKNADGSTKPICIKRSYFELSAGDTTYVSTTWINTGVLLAYTPKSATSRISIKFSGAYDLSGAVGHWGKIALFRDGVELVVSGGDAMQSAVGQPPLHTGILYEEDSPGSSSYIYRIKAKVSHGALYFHERANSYKYCLEICEYEN